MWTQAHHQLALFSKQWKRVGWQAFQGSQLPELRSIVEIAKGCLQLQKQHVQSINHRHRSKKHIISVHKLADLKKCLEWMEAQCQAGTAKPILVQSNLALPHVGGHLIHILKHHLIQIQVQTQTNTNCTPLPLRNNDMAIMDPILTTTTTHTDNKLRLVNSVRPHLNAHHISSITSIDGRTVKSSSFLGNPDNCCQPNSQPLRQCKPVPEAEKLWITAFACLVSTNRNLQQEPGPWTTHHSDRHKWKGHSIPNTNNLFALHEHNKWMVHKRVGMQSQITGATLNVQLSTCLPVGPCQHGGHCIHHHTVLLCPLKPKKSSHFVIATTCTCTVAYAHAPPNCWHHCCLHSSLWWLQSCANHLINDCPCTWFLNHINEFKELLSLPS